MLWQFLIVFLVESVLANDLYKFEEEVIDLMNPLSLIEAVAEGPKSTCQEDFNTVLRDAQLNKGYALKLLDATFKIPDGILIGNHYFMGQYYECLDVEHPDGKFSGKYCGLQLLNKNGKSPIPGTSYSFGFCAPSSCTKAQLDPAFQKISKSIIVHATDEYCYTSHDDDSLTGIDWFAVSVIIVLFTLACSSTTYELWQRKKLNNEKPNPLYSTFSIYQNGKAIFEVRKIGGGQMDCLNGIRSISMLWVIICHVALLMVYGPVNNVLETFADMTKAEYILISNGYLSVDTFFFLSGLLVAFVFFRDIGKSGSYDVPRTYISRYIRLTPPYAMIIFMQVTIVNYIGAGPLWSGTIGKFTDQCKEHWWTGILYVQNVVNPDSQCLIQTWYLSADMQMYWVAPLFLYPLYLWPMIGAGVLAVITVAAAFWSFGIGLIYELPYAPVFDTTGKENSMDNYVPWTRVSPWLVGVLLGFLICGLKAKKIEVKLKPMHVAIGWLVSGALLGSCMFGMIWFLDNPADVTVANAAAFLAFHRFGWALGLAWLVFACIYGYGGPINSFLSWSAFQVMAKMSYSVYLVHVSVIGVICGSFLTTLHSNYATIFMVFLPVVVYSHLLAIPLSLLVELPFSNLDKLYLRSIKILPFPKGKPERKPRQQTQALPTVTEQKEIEEVRPQEKFVQKEDIP